VGEWPSPYFHDVYVRNDTLFGSAFNEGSLVILDVSDKSNPTQIVAIPFPDGNAVHNAWTTEDGKYIMTTQEASGKTVKMWDIQDLSNPNIVGEYLASPTILAHNTHILGNYAYISHYQDGVRIVDISDPTHLVEVGYYDTFPANAGAAFEGNWGAFPFTSSGYIYATDEDYGLFVVSFNGRRAARLSGQVLDSQTGQPVSDVTIEVTELEHSTTSDAEGNYKLGFPDPGLFTILAHSPSYDTTTVTFMAEEGESKTSDIILNSVTSVDEEKSVIPASYSIEQNYPNPFNPNTTIRYSLPEKTYVRLKVFDTLGRQVRVLFDGEQLQGEQQTFWNGRDNSGRLVASGVYFYRIETDAFRKTSKMLFIQ
ncbi:choice-of-anchor B family protein, partial [candidate division KSB1 bacterium]|nr:choice-of-anchor B family protein [candidate division KSB1 bacterium]